MINLSARGHHVFKYFFLLNRLLETYLFIYLFPLFLPFPLSFSTNYLFRSDSFVFVYLFVLFSRVLHLLQFYFSPSLSLISLAFLCVSLPLFVLIQFLYHSLYRGFFLSPVSLYPVFSFQICSAATLVYHVFCIKYIYLALYGRQR